MHLSISPSFASFALFTVLTLGSCKDKADDTVHIEPPFQNLVPEFETFSIDIALGDTIEVRSGTRIVIPPHALTDSRDHLASGEAVILYREYRDEIDILLSGIPMEYKVGNERYSMGTEGMFELRAMQGILELGLAPNKSIEVQYATNDLESEVNLYALSNVTGQWESREYSKPVREIQRIMIEEQAEELLPRHSVPFDEDYFVFNHMEFLNQVKKNDDRQNRRKAKNEAYAQKVGKYGLKNYNLYAGSIIYKGERLQAYSMVWESVSGHKFPPWTSTKLCEVKRIKGDIYQLKVTDKRYGKSFALNARLVMPIKYVFKFTPQQWKANVETAREKITLKEERLITEEGLFRSMMVEGFGIYNFDQLVKQKYPFKINAKFEIAGGSDADEYEIKYLYGIPGNGKSIIRIQAGELHELYLNPSDSNFRFLAVLPDDRIGIFAAWQYSHIDFEKLATEKNPSYTFEMKLQPKSITSEFDLNHFLELARND